MKTLHPILCGVLTFAAIAVCCHAKSSPTPSPSPFDVNAVDMSKISEADIQATIAHRNALHQQLIDQTLPAASRDVKEAVAKAQVLQKDIDRIAIEAAKVGPLQDALAKAHKAIWRDIVVCLILGAAIGFLGPKIARLAAFFT